MNSGLFDGKYDNKVFAERIARLPLARQPGTLWRYGHSTDVIGRIIEIVSGQTLYQFEKQHIFDPLGMTSTKFVLESADEHARMAEPLPGDTILKMCRGRTPRPSGMGVRRRRTGVIPGRLCPVCPDDPQRRRTRRQTVSYPGGIQIDDDQIMSGRVPALRGTTSTFPAMASVTGMALRYAPIREMPNRRRPVQSANSNGIAAAAPTSVSIPIWT